MIVSADMLERYRFAHAVCLLFVVPAALVAQRPEGLVRQELEQAAREVPKLAQVLSLKPGMTVADVGSGGGAMAVWMAKWLGPDTVEFLEANARDRVIVAVPIAFVSEHLETLYDLDILAKDAARKGGARGFLRVPALGTRPDFVRAMADVVRKGAAAQPAAA